IGKVIEIELYKDSPITGKILSLNNPDKFSGSSYTLSPAGRNSFRLSGSSKVYPFGKPVQVPFGVIQMDAKTGISLSVPVKVVFRNLKSVISVLENSINVSLPPNKGMLMEVSLVGAVPQKSEDILNELTNQY